MTIYIVLKLGNYGQASVAGAFASKEAAIDLDKTMRGVAISWITTAELEIPEIDELRRGSQLLNVAEAAERCIQLALIRSQKHMLNKDLVREAVAREVADDISREFKVYYGFDDYLKAGEVAESEVLNSARRDPVKE